MILKNCVRTAIQGCMLLVAVFSTFAANASLIHNDQLNDAGYFSSSPVELGIVSDGDYIIGSSKGAQLPSSYDYDGYRFELDGSFSSINIQVTEGTALNNWQLFTDGLAQLDSGKLRSNLGLLSIVFDVSGFDGIFRLGNHIMDPDSDYSYQISFHGDSLSPVPVPATIWLFGSVLLGMLGFRRKVAH